MSRLANVIALYERHMQRKLVKDGAVVRWAHAGDLKVHVLDVKGEGPLHPVVLVHGFSATGASQYAEVVRYLRPRVSRILLPDLPGHGASDMPDHIDAPVMTGALRAVLDELVVRPGVVFASSMGGGVALRTALQGCDKLAGLILCSPAGAHMSEEEWQDFLRAFHVNDYKDALSLTDRIYGRRIRNRRLVALGLRLQFNRPNVRRILSQTRSTDLFTSGELAALNVPTLFLWGERERLLPGTARDFFHSNLPDHVTLESPDGHSHVPFLDRPRELAQRIIEFCEDLLSGSPQLDESDP